MSDKHFEYEEFFHERSSRNEEKKWKQRKCKVPLHLENLHRGRVVSISGEGAWVESEEKRILCSLKGLLKKEKIAAKNVIAVGDFVRFSDERSIEQIEERYSFLSRTDISGNKEQLIAVNIDQAIISVSIVNPPLKPSLVDRYLIAAEKGRMHPLVVINKIDLFDAASQKEKELYREFLSCYEPLGFPILTISTKTGIGLESLRVLLQGKSSVFSGQSGVGKSSLLNALFGLELKVGELAQKTSKGSHTTSVAEFLPLPGGGHCVDTPGIRSFGLWNLQVSDITAHFQEMTKIAKKCKYPDCTHREEPSCAVKSALEKGRICPLRYESYCTLLDELKQKGKPTWE